MMNKIAGLPLFFLLAMFVMPVSMAADADYSTVNNQWQVNSVTGSVQSKSSVTDAASWQPVTHGDFLTAPVQIKTGAEGRVVLSQRKDQTTVGPNSVIEFAKEKAQTSGLFSRIVQSIGHVLFKIENGEKRTVQIESPYLVSVVKGTTFSVQVTEKRAMVNLVEGALQVNAVGVVSSVNLKTGQMAVLAAGDAEITVFDLGTDESFDDADTAADTLSIGGINAVVGDVKDTVLQLQADNITPPGLIDIPGSDNPVQ